MIVITVSCPHWMEVLSTFSQFSLKLTSKNTLPKLLENGDYIASFPLHEVNSESEIHDNYRRASTCSEASYKENLFVTWASYYAW